MKALAKLNTAPQQHKEKSKDKDGLEKKEERKLFKNRISAATERRRGNRSSQKIDPIVERGERVYVLFRMLITFPTCQAERSPLKAAAP